MCGCDGIWGERGGRRLPATVREGMRGVGWVGGCNGEVVVGEVEVPDIRAFLAEDRVNREQCLRR